MTQELDRHRFGIEVEFGKVDALTLKTIDFRLPPDDPRTWVALREGRETLAASTRGDSQDNQSLRIGVGAPVWGVKSWVGSVYAQGLPSKEFLHAYGAQFNSIELNSTHYGIPEAATIDRWRDSTPEGFKFNVKFLQEISHRQPLGHDPGLVHAFCESILGLGDRLGVSFLQLPPTFTLSEAPQLRALFALLPRELPLAVEVRHESFFSDHLLVPRYYDLLRSVNAHVVITDVAGRRDVLHMSLPSSHVLVRFIGNSPSELGGLHETDLTRIEDWVHRIASWLKLGLTQLEFFVHQPDDVLAPLLINHLIDRLNTVCGTNVKPWTPQTPPTPNQMSFF